jgi:hypothetical protein
LTTVPLPPPRLPGQTHSLPGGQAAEAQEFRHFRRAAVDLARSAPTRKPSPKAGFLCGCSPRPFGTHSNFSCRSKELPDVRPASSSKLRFDSREARSKHSHEGERKARRNRRTRSGLRRAIVMPRPFRHAAGVKDLRQACSRGVRLAKRAGVGSCRGAASGGHRIGRHPGNLNSAQERAGACWQEPRPPSGRRWRPPGTTRRCEAGWSRLGPERRRIGRYGFSASSASASSTKSLTCQSGV